MSKAARVVYACEQCGHESPKWFGRCPSCNEWNSLVESRTHRRGPAGRVGPVSGFAPGPEPRKLSDIDPDGEVRLPMGVDEFDRVLGGGVVAGSVVLIGGDPGVGKSTLLLQAAARFASRHGPTLYVSGEESLQQVALRARRLGLDDPNLHLLSETDVDAAVAAAAATKPALLVVDSIQAVATGDVDGVPGSLAQVRETSARLIRLAKGDNIPVFIVGHVTKQGALAGPKVLEHAVDTVLYLEGERDTNFRIMRAVKNRFGSTDEIGIFEMGDGGLNEVADPSGLFLQERAGGQPGTAVVAALEGTRVLLIEVQALVGPTPFGGTPRRQVSGLDYQRAVIVLAVLERRCGLSLHTHDVYVNAAGGVRVSEPAADLAIALAVASAALDRALDPRVVVFGEVGLAGEVRGVRQAERRARAAAQLGFTRCIMPAAGVPSGAPWGLECVGAPTVQHALRTLTGR